ncbi:MAG: alpha-2-macroglobulin family protein, partial [Lentisphaerota bacterium]
DGKTGKANLQLKLEKGGEYRIRLSGTDRFGQTVTTECSVQVSDADDETKLRLFSDSTTLKVGQEAAVRLHSRLDQRLALVTMEGETILRHQILELREGYNALSLKVDHDLFPNFRLAVALIDGRKLRTAAREFTVERELKVNIQPIKETLSPGEEGVVELTVTDQSGKSVESELSLALVNEALYAVYPDPAAPILDFFQKAARRNAEFKTGSTCTFSYTGTTKQIAGEIRVEDSRLTREATQRKKRELVNNRFSRAMGQEEVCNAPAEPPQPMDVDRQLGGNDRNIAGENMNESEMSQIANFEQGILRKIGLKAAFAPGVGGKASPDVSLVPRREVRGEGRWLPSIITDAKGKARVTLPMPETTTAWRLTARGCTVETLVGEASTKLLTRKDFFVELKTASFLRERDDVRFVGRIHNITDYSGRVKLSLTLRSAGEASGILAVREKTIEVKAGSGAEVTFDSITVPGEIELDVELSGEAGSNKDKLSQVIPVKPWGIEYAAHAGGSSVTDCATTIALPEGHRYSSTWMTISVGPDIRTRVLDMALRTYWTGPFDSVALLCPPPWDDTSANDLLAIASALAYANQGNVEGTYRLTLAERARALVANLVATQDASGNWPQSGLGQLTSARAFWALVAARNAGIAVDPNVINKAAASLQQQFQNCVANDADTKAVILHALSTDKRADYANCNRLYRDRNTLGNATLAYLTHAFLNLDRKEIAAELAVILEGKAKIIRNHPDTLSKGVPSVELSGYWQSLAGICWESGCSIPWMNDTDETTALILQALAQTRPDSKMADSAARYLLKSHGCFGFPTARSRGPAVAALAAWFGKGLEQSTDMEIGMFVNGKEVGKIKADG